jgi:hypothetical protein
MSSTDESHQAFHRGAAPIFALPTAEQTRQRADAALADRLSDLAENANEGDLTPSERAEYDAYIEANNLLATLKAEARFRLASSQL